jgi:hypothetical protein
MTEIPDNPAALTVGWIADALKQGGIHVQGRLCALAQEPLVAGDGVFAEVIRLRLSYEAGAPGAPASVIVKLASASQANRERAAQFGLYGREVRFYEHLAPTLPLRIPRCYWSSFDPQTKRFALLLEDLDHLQVGDQLRGIPASRARTVANRLATAHARWWDSTRLDDLDWIPRLDGPITRQLADLYRDYWPAFVAIHGDHLPSGSIRLGTQVRSQLGELLTKLSRPPVTVIHGDLRAENLLFGQRAPHPIAVIDWQLAARGRGVFDVAYLLCQSMTVPERRRHEIEILRAWHRELVHAGISRYSFEHAAADYKLGALACLGYAVAGTTIQRAGDRGRAIAQTQAVRSFTAVLDLNAGELLDKPASCRTRGCKTPTPKVTHTV